MNVRKNPWLFAVILLFCTLVVCPRISVFAAAESFPLPCAGVERVLSRLSTSYIYQGTWKSGESGQSALPSGKTTTAEATQGEASPDESAPQNPSEPETAEETPEEQTEAPDVQEEPSVQQEAQPQQAAPAPASPNNRIVCIDAGHQAHGDNSKEPIGPGASETKAKVAGGTRGVSSGLAEYELTLAVALKLQNILTQRGYTVVMCRTSHDVNISNSERAQIANNAGAGAFIRLHANGSNSAASSGAETLAPSNSNPYCASIASASQSLSRHVLNGLCAKSGAKNRGVQIVDNMSGINWSKVPVTIVEMGFMTNPAEDMQMADDAYQTKLAEGMADGIDAYFAG